jgi:hypothetical protein
LDEGSNPSDSTFALRSLKSEAGLFYKQKVPFQILYIIFEGLRRLGPRLINA